MDEVHWPPIGHVDQWMTALGERLALFKQALAHGGVTQEQIIAELVYLDAAVREQVGNRVELLGHLMASGELIKGQASRIEEQGMLIDRLKAEVTDLRARLGE